MSALLALVWRRRRPQETTTTAAVEAAATDPKGSITRDKREALPLPLRRPTTVPVGLDSPLDIIQGTLPPLLLSSMWTMSSHGSSESENETPWRTTTMTTISESPTPALSSSSVTYATATIVVVTPEGLKPRRSMQALREELLWMNTLAAGDSTTQQVQGSTRDNQDQTTRGITHREEIPQPVSPCRSAASNTDTQAVAPAPVTTGTTGSMSCFEVTRRDQFVSLSNSNVRALTSPVHTTSTTTAKAVERLPVATAATMWSFESNRPTATGSALPFIAEVPMGRAIRLEDHHRCWFGADDASLKLPEQDTGSVNSAATYGLGVLPPIPSRSWSTTGENNDSHRTIESSTPDWSLSPTSTTNITTTATGAATNSGLPRSSSQRRQSRVSWNLDIASPNTGSNNSSSNNNSTPVAESPNLIPGHARTAVGQLVGAATVGGKPIMEDNDQNQQLVSTTPSYKNPRHRDSNGTGSTSHYPPDDWMVSPPEQNVESMYSPMLSATSKRSVRSNPLPLYTYGGGYPKTLSSSSQPQSPYTTTSALTMTPRLFRSVDDDENYCAPWTASSSVLQEKAGSMIRSSAASTRSLTSNTNNRLPLASPIQSTMKQRKLIQQQPVHLTSTQMMQHVAGYRWVVTTTTSSSHSSTSTCSDSHKNHHGSSPFGAQKRTIQEVPQHRSEQCTTSEKDRLFSPFRSSHEQNPITSEKVDKHPETLAYQRSKIRNQHRTKEELIMAALERLQDDIPLVQQMEALLLDRMDGPRTTATQGVSTMFDWYVSTPMDQEGILTGFSEANRYLLLERLDALLASERCDSTEQDATFNTNEHQVRGRDDLRHALRFCKMLVQMAIPTSEKEDDGALQGTDGVGRWHFLPELRPAIGLVSSTGLTATPPARGGDTSYFSLPHDDDDDQYDSTPMTSNVSVGASTLTTAVYAPRVFESSAAKRHERVLEQNGLCLRQAIQMLCTGLQLLTMTCAPLLTTSGLSPQLETVTDRIQRAYGQLLATMNYGDLKSIVDAFEFEQDMDDDSYCVMHVVDSTDDTNDDSDEKKIHVRPNISTSNPSVRRNASIVHDVSECLVALPPRHTVVIDYAESEIDRGSQCHNNTFDANGSVEDDGPEAEADCSICSSLNPTVTSVANEVVPPPSQQQPSSLFVVRTNTNPLSVVPNSTGTRQPTPLDTRVAPSAAATTTSIASLFRGCLSLDGRQPRGATDDSGSVRSSRRTPKRVRNTTGARWTIPCERVEI